MPNPFDTANMAAGYATARPAVHPRVIALAQPHLPTAARALDIGCGAGLSTRALAPVARHLCGIEPAQGMLAFTGAVAPTAHFAVAAAEALPFADRSFELLAAAGSLNYVHLEAFFPEARRVLAPGGALLVYDFAHGREFPSDPALADWFTEFLTHYPPVPSGARKLNPAILAELPSGFTVTAAEEFAIGLTLTRDFYLDYLLTSTNVGAALARGQAAGEIRAGCEASLAPAWGAGAREVLFRGYFAVMQPLSW